MPFRLRSEEPEFIDRTDPDGIVNMHVPTESRT